MKKLNILDCFGRKLLKKTKPTIINNSDFNISDQNGWICGMVVNFDRPEQLPVPVIVHSEFLRTWNGRCWKWPKRYRETRNIWEWHRRYRDKRLHGFFGDAMFKQKFKGTIGTHTLRSNLFDAALPSQVQSNMILTVFCFDVQIALD